MPAVSTSQRTYRYLRLALAGAPVALLVSVALAVPDAGVLPSLSHYFYTPARTVFSAALVAAAVCLLVLSGRGPQRVLLDVAALLAPLVAIVPTPVAPGEVPGLALDCAASCIPAPVVADLANAVTTYVVVGALVVVVGVVLGSRGDIELAAAAPTLAIAVGVLAAVALFATRAPAGLGRLHVVAAVAFFALIAGVALAEAIRPSVEHPPSRRLRIAYVGLAVALPADLVATFLLGVVAGLPVVLIGEVIALVIFVAFWLMQTAQKWSLADPSLRARPIG
ncbi:hypothetical protein [Microbacterium oleivorans]|uniref:Uncharacterized protein n=1 Tax=Microbacterium oleivorans TaxID=273677 RepID=A0A7D5F4J7_9MICO|nr:hypothetical protein [Microbacterium oleivorans]QLD11307.1 hypothetical protein HW566_05675 [Microbacterium oleivorans]